MGFNSAFKRLIIIAAIQNTVQKIKQETRRDTTSNNAENDVALHDVTCLQDFVM